jgi:hypothetical protein
VSLTKARSVLETMVATERLNYLDDLLTTVLASPDGPDDEDRATAVAIGADILESLERLRHEVGPIREFIDANGEAFDERMEQFLASTEGLQAADLQPFRAAGWHVVASDALRVIEESASVEDELARQIEELAGGTAIAGDFPRLFKCSLVIGFVAMGVAGSLLAGPFGPPTAMVAISSAGLGVFAIAEVCKGTFPRRSPISTA